MSKIGVQVKIDVSKIDKALLFKGAKGTYLDATVFIDIDTADQYGNNGMVTQDVSKEARDAGGKGPILGNVKIFWKGEGNSESNKPSQATQTRQAPSPSNFDQFEDDIPF
jgi:hypothetical protein